MVELWLAVTLATKLGSPYQVPPSTEIQVSHGMNFGAREQIRPPSLSN